jgi:DNA-binding XRE family transcriptional regulator
VSGASLQPSVPIIVLLGEARRALRMNQAEFAHRIGSSKRTVQRWETNRASPAHHDLQNLADAVRPHDPDLADKIDAWAPRPAPSALPAPPPVIAAPLPPPIPRSVFVNAIVCATVEASGLKPSEVRAMLLPAFLEAARARVTAADVAAELEASITGETREG